MVHAHPEQARKALIGGLILTAAFVVIEAVAGFLTNSLALVSDAGHMLADSAGRVRLWGPLGRLVWERAFGADADVFTLADAGRYILAVEGGRRIADHEACGMDSRPGVRQVERIALVMSDRFTEDHPLGRVLDAE